jgi:ABC-type polysaccharide/polyol phosphate export permease
VEGLRAVLVFGREPDWTVVMVSAALTATILTVSLVMFKRIDKYFADVI